ncbi:hypothetical protein GCM10023333_24370 [Ferrimonas pelagia]|uniref:Uncharacterized protein n=1 Tax=Ferrimonas pelagia TaxID=1177826 RepID=A0ABP9F0U8_9GAMM
MAQRRSAVCISVSKGESQQHGDVGGPFISWRFGAFHETIVVASLAAKRAMLEGAEPWCAGV